MGDAIPQRPQGRRTLSYAVRCERCGKGYYPIRHTQRFCSRECSHWVRLLPPKACLLCRKVFQPARRRIMYCSTTCARMGRVAVLGTDALSIHMAKMRDAAAEAHRQAAVDRAAAELPENISAVDAYRLGVKRGHNAGYQAGIRRARATTAAEKARGA